MELKNSFEVAASPAQSWDFLFTPERVTPCIPGAELVEVKEDGTWVVKAKVKLGPVTMNYKGQVNIVEKDEESWRVVMKGSGTETRGKGRVKADIVSTLAETESGGTRAEVISTIKISGKAAQFGRGMISDVAARFTQEFAEAMEYELASEAEKDASEAADKATAAAEKAAQEAKAALEADDDEVEDDEGQEDDDAERSGERKAATLDEAAAVAAIEKLVKRAEKAAKRAEKAATRAEAEAKRAEAEATKADAASKRAMAAAKKMELAAKARKDDRPVGGIGLVFWAISRAIGRFFRRLFGGGSNEKKQLKES